MIDSLAQFIQDADRLGLMPAARAIERREEKVSDAEIDARMLALLPVMRQSAEKGMDKNLRSMSGMTGGQAARLSEAVLSGATAGGEFLGGAAARAYRGAPEVAGGESDEDRERPDQLSGAHRRGEGGPETRPRAQAQPHHRLGAVSQGDERAHRAGRGDP